MRRERQGETGRDRWREGGRDGEGRARRKTKEGVVARRNRRTFIRPAPSRKAFSSFPAFTHSRFPDRRKVGLGGNRSNSFPLATRVCYIEGTRESVLLAGHRADYAVSFFRGSLFGNEILAGCIRILILAADCTGFSRFRDGLSRARKDFSWTNSKHGARITIGAGGAPRSSLGIP